MLPVFFTCMKLVIAQVSIGMSRIDRSFVETELVKNYAKPRRNMTRQGYGLADGASFCIKRRLFCASQFACFPSLPCTGCDRMCLIYSIVQKASRDHQRTMIK